MSNIDTTQYRVWGADKVIYGPVTQATLLEWIREERVLPETWILLEEEDTWIKAKAAPGLASAFNEIDTPSADSIISPRNLPNLPAGFPLGSLRRIKLLSEFEPAQLASFVRYLEILPIKQFTVVVRSGDPGDAMFLVLEGELRARILVDGKETTLATMGVGDFFGEVSLLDHGPRSADVVANQASLLLKISNEAFARLKHEAPALALPFLDSLSQSIVGRMRSVTKKYGDSIHFSRTASGR